MHTTEQIRKLLEAIDTCDQWVDDVLAVEDFILDVFMLTSDGGSVYRHIPRPTLLRLREVFARCRRSLERHMEAYYPGRIPPPVFVSFSRTPIRA
jgi:hypothetical protein